MANSNQYEKADFKRDFEARTPASAGAQVCNAVRPACLSTQVPMNRSYYDEAHPDINAEFNDYASIALDSMDPACKYSAVNALNGKLGNTLQFVASGGTVPDTHSGQPVHPFRNWLTGDEITHMMVAAMQLTADKLPLNTDYINQAIDAYSQIGDRQDATCGNQQNSCLDDYSLTASGFAWIGAYIFSRGGDPAPYIARSKGILAKAFAPMNTSGSICYWDSIAQNCFGSPAGLATGRVRIIGADHQIENPTYGYGMMMSVASTCLGLFLSGSPCDFNTVDSNTGLTWRQVATGLFQHARSKTDSATLTFTKNCVSMANPNGPLVDCADTNIAGGYSPDMYPGKRFYSLKIGWPSDFQPGEFQFDQFRSDYSCLQSSIEANGTMYSRTSFWGLNRFVFYNLLANEAWPGGSMNAYWNFVRNQH